MSLFSPLTFYMEILIGVLGILQVMHVQYVHLESMCPDVSQRCVPIVIHIFIASSKNINITLWFFISYVKITLIQASAEVSNEDIFLRKLRGYVHSISISSCVTFIHSCCFSPHSPLLLFSPSLDSRSLLACIFHCHLIPHDCTLALGSSF